MIEASARYSGAMRLDHVLGLGRLYLVPSGMSPRNGAYVAMPLDALWVSLRWRARRSAASSSARISARCRTDFARLQGWGVWSYQVMLFERDNRGEFRGADHYRG